MTAPILAMAIIGGVWLLVMLSVTVYLLRRVGVGGLLLVWVMSLALLLGAVIGPCGTANRQISDDNRARQHAPVGMTHFDTGSAWTCDYQYLDGDSLKQVTIVNIDGDYYLLGEKIEVEEVNE